MLVTGVSVYLGLKDYPIEKTIAYLHEASQKGITTVFTSLHIPEASDCENEWKRLNEVIKELQMKLIVDISRPRFDINKLPDNIYALRLDWGFTDEETVRLSHELPCLIELNASILDQKKLKKLVAMGLQVDKVRVSFNFYPKKYTGMALDDVINMTKAFKEYGLTVMAYLPSMVGKRPPVYNGLPTVEAHRYQPLEISIYELILTGVDEIVFGDAYASSDEMALLNTINPSIINIPIMINDGLSSEELLVLKAVHRLRKDQSPYLIRSSATRGQSIKAQPASKLNNHIDVLTITIDNELYLRYQGELGIVLQVFPIDERINIVGHVKEEAKTLLSLMPAGAHFKFTWEG